MKHAERVRDLFVGALDLPEPAQRALLDQAADRDAAVAAEVAALLAARPSGDFLEPPDLADALPQPTAFGPFVVDGPCPEAANCWLGHHREQGTQVRIEHHLVPATGRADRVASCLRQVHATHSLGRGFQVVHGHGTDPAGVWLALARPSGHSLRTELAYQRGNPVGPRLLEAGKTGDWPRRVGRLGHHLAALLARAHAVGLVHGALTTDRVWLDLAGEVEIGGFGDAALAARQPPPSDDVTALVGLLFDALAAAPNQERTPNGQRLVAWLARCNSGPVPTMAEAADELRQLQATMVAPRPKIAPRWLRWWRRD